MFDRDFIIESVHYLSRLVREMKDSCSQPISYLNPCKPGEIEAEADIVVRQLEEMLPPSDRLIEAVAIDEAFDTEPLSGGDFYPYRADMGVVFFRVTEAHLKAIARLKIYEIGCYYDCKIRVPQAGRKRPFGNSGIYSDLAEIMGIEVDWDEELPPEQEQAIERFSEEVVIALQVCTRTLSFKPGLYKAHSFWKDYWVPAEEDDRFAYFPYGEDLNGGSDAG